jgi:hypothetical protein
MSFEKFRCMIESEDTTDEGPATCTYPRCWLEECPHKQAQDRLDAITVVSVPMAKILELAQELQKIAYELEEDQIDGVKRRATDIQTQLQCIKEELGIREYPDTIEVKDVEG